MNKVYLVISLILVTATMCLAQTGSSADRMTVASGTAIDAQLQKNLDASKANVGDEVVLKVAKSIKQNGEVVIPKGTALIGRVTEVTRRTKENSSSRIGIVFDRIEKNGISAPFSASIVSIVNASAQAAAGDAFMADTSGSMQTSGSVSRGGSGGGLLGGVGGTVGGVVNTATQTAGVVSNTAIQGAGAATGTVGRTLSGVQISNSVSGNVSSSTTFSSPNKNVRIEKGATFNLRVASAVDRQE
jgi:hypothetical protein